MSISPSLETETFEANEALAAAEGRLRHLKLDAQRALKIRAAYTTRFVATEFSKHPGDFHLVAGAEVTPQPGDVVIARVAEIGKHTRLESPVSRRQLMFVGQEIMVAYGNRYAPDQFLAHVPDSLEACHLVAGGGLAGYVTEMHASIDAATAIEPLGLLATKNGVVNLRDFAPLQVGTPSLAALRAVGTVRPPVIAVLGTSMNSGKSTTLGCLVNGLSNAGLNVAAGKATGTGAGNDPNLFIDAGAFPVCDFTDFGYPTTFKLAYEQVRDLLAAMINEQAASGADVVVIEIADGLYQGETSRLLRDPLFAAYVDTVVFSAQDALGARAGLDVLQDAGVPVAAVSGLLTASPLATAEAASRLDVPVIDTYALCNPEVATALIPVRAASL
jgi:GTP-binding protein EngB required for normal cell division